MQRYYYNDTFSGFQSTGTETILGKLALANEFALEERQRFAWIEEINILKDVLQGLAGSLYFEYSIPRMGKRIDVVLIIQAVIFVLEFKTGFSEMTAYAEDQVWDYALDLKNFHETSHTPYIVPILITSKAVNPTFSLIVNAADDRLLAPINCSKETLRSVIDNILIFCDGDDIDVESWEKGSYNPTPTIIEAAMALYNGHSVQNISRNDAGAKNLKETSDEITEIIRFSREKGQKSICFVTGVPGAGKTLVGLNIATKHIDKDSALYSVFLSGNGPLVAVLREALARDKVRHKKEQGSRLTLNEARREVKLFIQNIYNFRDECLVDMEKPPLEHVALFDEAQRAWDVQMIAKFMTRKKNRPGFNMSEPEFLISCLDRHLDWATVVCLVGGGQEINTGEAGISEWIRALNGHYSNWVAYISPHLSDTEYGAGNILKEFNDSITVVPRDNLHLSVSMRSFRSENVSLLVKNILDIDITEARRTLAKIGDQYPIVITRDVTRAKQWLKEHARGSERYGMLVSSQAIRLKPYAIDVKAPVDPIHWFLDEKDDIRSSYYLEDVVTEFQVQGLEVDWSCVVWDGDFRFEKNHWVCRSFVGNRWNRVLKLERQQYLKNAYRVLLTRARQGMVIVVPTGDETDGTRDPVYYDSTFQYLIEVGIPILE